MVISLMKIMQKWPKKKKSSQGKATLKAKERQKKAKNEKLCVRCNESSK